MDRQIYRRRQGQRVGRTGSQAANRRRPEDRGSTSFASISLQSPYGHPARRTHAGFRLICDRVRLAIDLVISISLSFHISASSRTPSVQRQVHPDTPSLRRAEAPRLCHRSTIRPF